VAPNQTEQKTAMCVGGIDVEVWSLRASVLGSGIERLRCVRVQKGEIEGGRVQECVMLRPGTGGGMHHRG
jgi:hypothetical protein